MPDVVIVGAGIVGAACAFYASKAGMAVTVLERNAVGGGTTSRGEGNILVSDKGAGPELALAVESAGLWRELAAEFGPGELEFEEKGGVVVAMAREGLAALQSFAEDQEPYGVRSIALDAPQLIEHEPRIAADLPGGRLYPQDMQVQPALAAAVLLAAAKERGAVVVAGAEATGLRRDAGGRLTSVRTATADHPTKFVVNAAGAWAATVGQRFGAPVPISPRRGFVLVTEPLPLAIRHKVYSADYVADVSSEDAQLQSSPVVEGTRGGTVLIGASRERVGFDTRPSVDVIRRLAAQAIRLFPFLADVHLMRFYAGFRPYCPDHLPLIGPDDRVPGLLHACGHEGAGIGLAPGTARMVVDLMTGRSPGTDPTPFRPGRPQVKAHE